MYKMKLTKNKNSSNTKKTVLYTSMVHQTYASPKTIPQRIENYDKSQAIHWYDFYPVLEHTPRQNAFVYTPPPIQYLNESDTPARVPLGYREHFCIM